MKRLRIGTESNLWSWKATVIVVQFVAGYADATWVWKASASPFSLIVIRDLVLDQNGLYEHKDEATLSSLNRQMILFDN